jgi:hypothetical protein
MSYLMVCIGLFSSAESYAGNWNSIQQKDWDGFAPKNYGKIVDAPDQYGCYSSEIPPDKAMVFDIAKFSNMAGSRFDPNKIRVDSSGEDGAYALESWLDSWEGHGYGHVLVPENQNWNKGNQKDVLICVGSGVLVDLIWNFVSIKPLKSIFLWYDGPLWTPPIDNTQKPGQPKHSPTNARNMANTDDALKAAGNGQTLRDTHGVSASGSSQGTISGPRVDLEPDFDVYDTNGNEISANCNNCMGKSVDVGQTVHAKLKTEVSNADAKDFKRSSSSQTIEGCELHPIPKVDDFAGISYHS